MTPGVADFEFPYPAGERGSIPPARWELPDWDEDRILRLAAVIAHPVRLAVLVALKVEPGSPTMLAAQMNVSLGVVSYHFTTLVKAGAVGEVANRGVRGTVEHFYGLNEFGDECLEMARIFGHDPSPVLPEEPERAPY